MLIEDKIRDSMNQVWRSVVLLLEIAEIVCAPTIHKSWLPYRGTVINEYIVYRKNIGPNLRPKHHYLMHYPELILKFGPLMKVWSMRFESKHTYLKRILRYSRNHINVTKSLTEEHELFPSFLRSGADIRVDIELKGAAEFDVRIYNEIVQAAIEKLNLSCDIQQCSEIVVKGITYRNGDCSVIRQKGYEYGIEVGKMSILLSDEKSVFVVCEVFDTFFCPHLRVYQIGKCVRYDCLPLDELPSTEKLHIYNSGSFLCVKTNYGMVAPPL